MGCNADVTHTEVRCGQNIMELYGVSNLEEACVLAKHLVDQDFEWLELCGGFHEDGCARVVEAVNDRVPVGYIDYLPENDQMRKILPKDETYHMDWTYIFVDPVCRKEGVYGKLTYRNGSRDIHLYGVQTVEDGLDLSVHLVQKARFPLIELSGDFGVENCKKAVELVGDRALIGYVTWISGKKSR